MIARTIQFYTEVCVNLVSFERRNYLSTCLPWMLSLLLKSAYTFKKQKIYYTAQFEKK
jgi:hypothetical protein